MAACCQGTSFWYDPETDRLRRWNSACDDRFCPRCSHIRTARIADRVLRAIDGMDEARFLTVTWRSCDDPLDVQFAQMRAASRKFRSLLVKLGYAVGGIDVIEATYNLKTKRYHPHTHSIVEGIYIPKRLVSKLWQQITGHSRITDIRGIGGHREAAMEMARYVGKPPELTTWPNAVIRDYAHATKGMHCIAAWGSCYRRQAKQQPAKPKSPLPAYRVTLSRLATRAAMGVPTAVMLALAIGERWEPLGNYIAHRAPQLELPDDHRQRLRDAIRAHDVDRVAAGVPRGPPTTYADKLDRRLVALFHVYQCEEADGEYFTADYRYNQQHSYAATA